MKYKKASEPEIATALGALPGWQVRAGKLHKQFKFASFEGAMTWMTQVASEVTQLNHHPEWCNVYSQVTVDLVTHDLGNSISNLDLVLAEIMESLAAGVDR